MHWGFTNLFSRQDSKDGAGIQDERQRGLVGESGSRKFLKEIIRDRILSGEQK